MNKKETLQFLQNCMDKISKSTPEDVEHMKILYDKNYTDEICNMERLTTYDEGNEEILINEEEILLCKKGFVNEDDMNNIIRNLRNKLFIYEELEEQGLLLHIPCKVGDTVYTITRNFISEYIVCRIEKYNEELFFDWICKKGIYINCKGFAEYEIGETVFLTREEAENKLKEISK